MSVLFWLNTLAAAVAVLFTLLAFLVGAWPAAAAGLIVALIWCAIAVKTDGAYKRGSSVNR